MVTQKQHQDFWHMHAQRQREEVAIERLNEPFAITSVSRQDLVDAGFRKEDVLALDTLDMERLACKMGDAYVSDGSFWDDICLLTDLIFDLRRGQEEEEDEEDEEEEEEDEDALLENAAGRLFDLTNPWGDEVSKEQEEEEEEDA